MPGRYQRHFFVCQTKRPPFGKPSCGAKGSDQVLNTLIEALGTHQALWGSVTVTACGCLGPCVDGPSIVVYPEGVWYAHVTPDDAREIAQSHLVDGKPVERLFYQWPETPETPK
jgi:(2Fe-2S) ferredoxin